MVGVAGAADAVGAARGAAGQGGGRGREGGHEGSQKGWHRHSFGWGRTAVADSAFGPRRGGHGGVAAVPPSGQGGRSQGGSGLRHPEVVGGRHRGPRVDGEPEGVQRVLALAHVVDADALGQQPPDPVVVARGMRRLRLRQLDPAVLADGPGNCSMTCRACSGRPARSSASRSSTVSSWPSGRSRWASTIRSADSSASGVRTARARRAHGVGSSPIERFQAARAASSSPSARRSRPSW